MTGELDEAAVAAEALLPTARWIASTYASDVPKKARKRLREAELSAHLTEVTGTKLIGKHAA